MEDMFAQILQPLMLYVLLTFLVTTAIKKMLAATDIMLGDYSIFVAVLVAGVFSYGWSLTLLPAETAFQRLVNIILVAIIVGATASGTYSWAKKFIPWLQK